MTNDQITTADGKQQIEREHTNQSLRRERMRTDLVLAAKRKIRQNLADDLVDRARVQADEVLDTAREKADEKLDQEGATRRESKAVCEERVEEDEVLMHERAAADDNLRLEREEQARLLAALLPMERERTDRFLNTEREFSDDSMANRDDFMGMISHELRNLLTGIGVYAKLLTMQASDSDEGRRTRAGMLCIERYAARMNRLIEDLVDIASIDAGKLAVYPHPGNVTEMIAEAMTPLRHAANGEELSLQFSGEGQVLSAVFDRERTQQVISNLIVNAIRFTPRGGFITIEAASTEGNILVSVLDTGEGIAADMREVIFERFKQANGNKHNGLGLGLYISRCIVEAQGGRIWAEENPDGAGSVFHFTIPLERNENGPAA